MNFPIILSLVLFAGEQSELDVETNLILPVFLILFLRNSDINIHLILTDYTILESPGQDESTDLFDIWVGSSNKKNNK